MDKPFYVYILRRPNGEPFYVGMGSGDRITQHEKRARKERSHKASIIRSIWAAGLTVEGYIVERFDEAADAKSLEVELIRSIGRRDLGAGPLANHSDGGDGVTGWSKEMRESHSGATSAGMARPEVRAACKAHMERCRLDPVWAAARASEISTYWRDPSNRAAQSVRLKKYFSDDSVRAQHAERQRRALNNPLTRNKMRLAKLGKKQSPDFVAKRMAGKRLAAQRRASGMVFP